MFHFQFYTITDIISLYPIFSQILSALMLKLARIPSSKGFKIFLNPDSSISLKGQPFIVTSFKHAFSSVFLFIFTEIVFENISSMAHWFVSRIRWRNLHRHVAEKHLVFHFGTPYSPCREIV